MAGLRELNKKICSFLYIFLPLLVTFSLGKYAVIFSDLAIL